MRTRDGGAAWPAVGALAVHVSTVFGRAEHRERAHRGVGGRTRGCCLATRSDAGRAAAAGKRITAPSMSLAGLMGPSDWVDDDTVIDGADCSEMMKHWSDIPSFSDP